MGMESRFVRLEGVLRSWAGVKRRARKTERRVLRPSFR